MKPLCVLLLTTTVAAAQSSGFDSSIDLSKHPLGDLLMLTGNDVSGRGTVIARLVIENVSGRPLEVAVNGDAHASIGSCSQGSGEFSTPVYAGIVVGFDPTKHTTLVSSHSPTLQQALRPLPAGERIQMTMQVTDCNLVGKSTTPVVVPVYVRDTSTGTKTHALTVSDVPVMP